MTWSGAPGHERPAAAQQQTINLINPKIQIYKFEKAIYCTNSCKKLEIPIYPYHANLKNADLLARGKNGI